MNYRSSVCRHWMFDLCMNYRSTLSTKAVFVYSVSFVKHYLQTCDQWIIDPVFVDNVWFVYELYQTLSVKHCLMCMNSYSVCKQCLMCTNYRSSVCRQCLMCVWITRSVFVDIVWFVHDTHQTVLQTVFDLMYEL